MKLERNTVQRNTVQVTQRLSDFTPEAIKAAEELFSKTGGVEYAVSFTGMDGLEHKERHVGDEESLKRFVTFLEERGGHSITVESDDAASED